MSAAGHELVVERTFDAPREIVWRAMTEHFAEWWCPRPWRAEPIALEWRSGGRFSVAMHGPDGEVHGGDGTMLEVTPGERFVFTNMLADDWTPQAPQPVGIVGEIAIADAGNGRTHYCARARHRSEADRDAHAEMGFEQGWGICADQLGEVAQRLKDQGGE